MRFVTSATYSVRIDSSIFGMIQTKRGLKQDDHLSPYLFVLCAQWFLYIFTKAVERRLFQGVNVANSCPVVSHPKGV